MDGKRKVVGLGLAGLTISEDDGLEKLEEFFGSLTTLSASSALTLRSSAICSSSHLPRLLSGERGSPLEKNRFFGT